MKSSAEPMAFVSVLNDVIGPVMRGPSSSHTAGAYRIALLASRILGARPVSVRCTFDPEGSYAATFQPLGVDLAIAAALLGWEMTDERYEGAVQELRTRGIELSFGVEPLDLADHPNATRVDLQGEDGQQVRVWARSVGGGVVEIYRVNDTELFLTGKERTLLVFLSPTATPDSASRIARSLGLAEPLRATGRILSFALPPERSVEKPDATAQAGVERQCLVEPVFYVQQGPPLFASAREAVDLAAARGWSLGETARQYEARILGQSPAWVDAEMLRRFRIMADSVAAGLDDGRARMPLLAPSASAVLRADQEHRLPSGGPLTRAAARAMAAMHTCNSRGVVCAAPTGGSAGVLPGVLLTLKEERGLSDREIVDALLASSAVGLIVAVRATFAAEVAGCQVEIGAAGAMAAAAVVEGAGGSAGQAFAAASVALQNTMGSVCDPVQGGCEIPCQTRNAVAAANAFICADLVMGGYANPIPFDESVDASLAVGKSLPRELRCTALGGIAAAPSARAMRPAT